MNRPRTFEQRLESWLEEGPATAPEDLVDAVRVGVHDIDPKRRRNGVVRRFPVLSSLARFGAAVAAVLVIGLVGFSLLNSKPGGIGAGPTASPTATLGPTSGVPAICAPADLAARITGWDGAAGQRTATVVFKNTSAAACMTRPLDRPQLVGGDGSVLIDGVNPPTKPDAIVLEAGQTVTTLVQDGNYCGTTPVVPVTLAFVLPDGAGRIVAAPLNGTDTEGVPPCNGPAGSAGDISMHAWAK